MLYATIVISRFLKGQKHGVGCVDKPCVIGVWSESGGSKTENKYIFARSVTKSISKLCFSRDSINRSLEKERLYKKL